MELGYFIGQDVLGGVNSRRDLLKCGLDFYRVFLKAGESFCRVSKMKESSTEFQYSFLLSILLISACFTT